MTRIILIRHGESGGNARMAEYHNKGDAYISLTDKGWEQAIKGGGFLTDFYARTETSQWPTIFLSPFQRTRETLSGILHGMSSARSFEGIQRLHEDPRLIEQSFGAMAHAKNAAEKHKNAGQSLIHFSSAARKGNPFASRPPFGESPKDILLNAKSFIDGTLSRDISEGKCDFLIVTHGALTKAFIFSWFHLPVDAWKTMETPGNGDIFCLEGTKKNWVIRRIYDGENDQPDNSNPIENIKPLTVDELPQPPLHLLNRKETRQPE